MKKHTAFYCLLFLSTFSNKLTAATQQIPDVLVRNQHWSSDGAPQTVLTRYQLSQSGATRLSDALSNSAGLQLHDASGTGSFAALGMRGFGGNASSNSLIMINGIPLSNPDLAPPDINTLPLEDINKIEIISGSESVLYGDQAVGGLINIITDESSEKNLRLQCGTGSYRLRECHAKFSDHYRTLDYQFNLTSKSTDNYRQHNHYLNNTFLAGATYQQLKLDYKFTLENMQFPGALTAAQVIQNRSQASNSTDYFKDNNQYLHLRYLQPVYEIWKLNIDAFARTMDGSGVLFTPFSQTRGSIFLRPQLSATFGKANIKSGFDARVDRYHLNSAYGLTNNNQAQGGIFGLIDYRLKPKLTLIAGLRGAEQSTQLNTNISASTINRAAAVTLGATYDATHEIAFFLRRAGSYRFPKAEENSGSNQPLRTQRGVSYEAGVSYDQAERAIDFSIYQLNLRDEIAFDPLQTPTNPFGTNTNLSPTVRTGGSIAGRQNINNIFTADAQINYVDARFRNGVDAGNQIPLVSDWIMRGGLLTRITNQWHAYAEAIFTGKQFPSNDNGNVTGGVGGYTIYNFNLKYQYRSFNVALHINNIFNKYFYLYTVYQTGTEYFYPAPDRNYMLTVSYAFD